MGANLVVNISSFYDGCDDTCLLDRGDHPFVQHCSYVFYARAEICKASNLQSGISQGKLRPQADMSEDVFFRVLEGFHTSPDTAMRILKYLNR
ncbi:hypothetical protein [Halocynthiibacter styelae]|nr:hypothetical protein [Paenihalocynthiibacter styelae]